MALARENAEVAIAGGGPAAAATAIALASSGIGSLLLIAQRPSFRMAEGIPAATLRLFEALGLTDLVRRIGCVVKGLKNRWDTANPIVRVIHLLSSTVLSLRCGCWRPRCCAAHQCRRSGSVPR